MNKMERPMMTVVRFGAEDVIATSAIALNNTYSAMGSEIQQYSNTGGSTVYGQSWDNNGTLYSIMFSEFGVKVNGESDSFNYAWYNETSGNWLTDEQTIDYYGGNLPQ